MGGRCREGGGGGIIGRPGGAHWLARRAPRPLLHIQPAVPIIGCRGPFLHPGGFRRHLRRVFCGGFFSTVEPRVFERPSLQTRVAWARAITSFSVSRPCGVVVTVCVVSQTHRETERLSPAFNRVTSDRVQPPAFSSHNKLARGGVRVPSRGFRARSMSGDEAIFGARNAVFASTQLRAACNFMQSVVAFSV